MARNPLRSILSVRRDELGRSLLMFVYFFLVISTFWILKPLKKSLFVAFYDVRGLTVFGRRLGPAEAELFAKELNIAVAFVAMIGFARISTRLRREKLSSVLAAFCATVCVLFSFALRDPGAVTIWGFYLFGDLFSTLMVAGFFAFLNDSVDTEGAKRTYGLVGLGGVLGGVFGSGTLAGLLDHFSSAEWALVCAGLSVVILLVALAAGRAGVPPDASARGSTTAPALEAPIPVPRSGARLVFASRYYRSIFGIVCIYEVVSSVMDFQFSWTVSSFLDGDAIGRQFARVFLLTNVLSLCVQLFVTTPLMRRGVTKALLVLPVAAGLGSLTFALVPMLWTGSLLNTWDNAFSYSIQQSAKESLYVPAPSEEKYRAKAFIDMFGQRLAKGFGVLLVLAISVTLKDLLAVRFLSLLTIALVALWLYLSRFAGKRFDEEANAPGVPDPVAGRRPEAV
jgi:ATP:ADP antiporter, AAA family